MQSGDVLSLVGMLAGFFLILFLAYWATKVLARGYAAGGAGRNRLLCQTDFLLQ